MSVLTDSGGYVLVIVLLMTSLLISITGNFIVETQTRHSLHEKI
jgi:hypothetical protein